MKVLVTGANGYIGRHIVDALIKKGCEVIATDISVSNVNCSAERIESNIFTLPNDINFYEYFGKPDVCIHMAWRNGFIHNAETHIEDLSGHYHFLTKIINDGLKHLAVMGTMHEVGYWEGAIDENTPCNPSSLYGIAKDTLRKVMIQFCANKSCILQWLRCFYILGDDKMNNSIFGKLLAADERGEKTFPFTTGKNQYDFIDVDELSDQISCVLMQTDVIGIINCCSGSPESLAERVEKFIQEHGLKIQLQYGAFPDRPYDSPCVYGDSHKINKILNDYNSL